MRMIEDVLSEPDDGLPPGAVVRQPPTAKAYGLYHMEHLVTQFDSYEKALELCVRFGAVTITGYTWNGVTFALHPRMAIRPLPHTVAMTPFTDNRGGLFT